MKINTLFWEMFFPVRPYSAPAHVQLLFVFWWGTLRTVKQKNWGAAFQRKWTPFLYKSISAAGTFFCSYQWWVYSWNILSLFLVFSSEENFPPIKNDVQGQWCHIQKPLFWAELHKVQVRGGAAEGAEGLSLEERRLKGTITLNSSIREDGASSGLDSSPR